MECPAICCLQMRLTPSSHAGRVCYPRGFIRQQGNDADPGMPRTDDRRAPHRDLASDSRGQIAIIDADSRAQDFVRVLPGYLTG